MLYSVPDTAVDALAKLDQICKIPGRWFVCMSVCMYVCIYILGLHPWQMGDPGLGVELELQLPAYTTATAMQNPSLRLQPTPQLTAMPDP